jgi:uncharacterized Zn-finger protein
MSRSIRRALNPEKTMEPEEIIPVKDSTISCDGGPLGHPRVYLNLGAQGQVDCPYCGRRFVLEAGTSASTGH